MTGSSLLHALEPYLPNPASKLSISPFTMPQGWALRLQMRLSGLSHDGSSSEPALIERCVGRPLDET